MSLPKIEICEKYRLYAKIIEDDLSYLHNVSVIATSIREATHRVIIIPGNCQALKYKFSMCDSMLNDMEYYKNNSTIGIMDEIQQKIKERWEGYLPIGLSLLLPIIDEYYTHIIYMPITDNPNVDPTIDSIYYGIMSAMNIIKENNIIGVSMPMINYTYSLYDSSIVNKIGDAIYKSSYD